MLTFKLVCSDMVKMQSCECGCVTDYRETADCLPQIMVPNGGIYTCKEISGVGKEPKRYCWKRRLLRREYCSFTEAPAHKSGCAETDFTPLSPELATISYSTLTLNYV
jgi:hypothetical protein